MGHFLIIFEGVIFWGHFWVIFGVIFGSFFGVIFGSFFGVIFGSFFGVIFEVFENMRFLKNSHFCEKNVMFLKISILSFLSKI